MERPTFGPPAVSAVPIQACFFGEQSTIQDMAAEDASPQAMPCVKRAM